MRITKGGQISIPAEIRHRWGTSTVALDDEGDRIIVRPAPDDPIAAAEGALRKSGAEFDLARFAGRRGRMDVGLRHVVASDDLARRLRVDRWSR